MTSPPSPPNRRRRRIVVVLVLVLVSMVVWWHWPRGDARFVGKWRFVAPTQPPNVVSTIWTLKRNGEMWMTGSYVTPATTIDYYSSWRTEDALLVTGWNDRSWGDWILAPLQAFFTSRSKTSFIFRRETWKVLSIKHDQIELQAVGDGQAYALVRIPE